MVGHVSVIRLASHAGRRGTVTVVWGYGMMVINMCMTVAIAIMIL